MSKKSKAKNGCHYIRLKVPVCRIRKHWWYRKRWIGCAYVYAPSRIKAHKKFNDYIQIHTDCKVPIYCRFEYYSYRLYDYNFKPKDKDVIVLK